IPCSSVWADAYPLGISYEGISHRRHLQGGRRYYPLIKRSNTDQLQNYRPVRRTIQPPSILCLLSYSKMVKRQAVTPLTLSTYPTGRRSDHSQKKMYYKIGMQFAEAIKHEQARYLTTLPL